MSGQQTSSVQHPKEKELISMSSLEEEYFEKLELQGNRASSKTQIPTLEESIGTKFPKTAWHSTTNSHKSWLADIGESADEAAFDNNDIEQNDQMTAPTISRKESFESITSTEMKKRRRSSSMRGHFNTPVRGTRRWSLNSRKTRNQSWSTSMEIMNSIYGINKNKQSKVAVNLALDPAQIATDMLLKHSEKELGIDLLETLRSDDGESLFKEKMKSLSSGDLNFIACELFSAVRRSNELMRVACAVNQGNSDKRNTMEIIIEKTHQMVGCTGVCLYLLDEKNRLIIALTDEADIYVDARISWRSLVGRCAFTNEVIRQCDPLHHYDVPEFKSGVELPESVMYVPIHGKNVEVIGILGVYDSPKPQGFDSEDESKLVFVAALAGYTMVNMLQFERQAHKSEQVEYLMKSISRMESHMEQGPQNTISELVELSYELFHCERIGFFEIDGDEMLCTVSRDFIDGRLPKNKGVIGHVVKTGKIVNIPDAYKDPRFNKAVDQKTKFHTTSILAAPVKDENSKVIGVIQCINKKQAQGKFTDPIGIANTYNIKQENGEPLMPWSAKSAFTDVISEGILEVPEMGTCPLPRSPKKGCKMRHSYSYKRSSSLYMKNEIVPFPKADELLIKALAKSAGVVIVKARLFRKLVMAQRKNKALIHVLHVTSTDMDLPDMLDEIATATCEIIRANRISIFLVDNDEKRLCSIVSRDSEMINLCVPLGKGIVGKCFKSKRTIRVDDPYNDERFLQEIDHATGFETTSVLAVPIADAHGNYVGVLQALNKKDDKKFTTEDEDLLLSISKEVGESIRRGLVMLDTKTRELLLADKTQYPWQSAMMEIYSRNYISGLPRATPVVASLRSEVSTSLPNNTAEMADLYKNTGLSVWPSMRRAEILESMGTCNFDVLNYDENLLNDFSFLMFANTQVLEQFDIPEDILRNFINAVGTKYLDNPYHNYYHAVHVLQSVYFCLHKTEMHKYLCNIDILGILVSALCHDVNHPGHCSDFELKTDSKLSLLYNDVSVLENMHAHETFMLLQQEEFNIFANLNKADRKELRKIIINAILATDMTHHKNFTTKLGQKPSVEEAFDVEDASARQFLVDVFVHAADISAQVYAWEIAFKWEERINREFVMQVEKERRLGLTPSSFMAELDQPMKRFKSQLFFCDVILKPFWKGLAMLFPGLLTCVEQLETNRLMYQEELNKYIPQEVRDENSNEEVKVTRAPIRRKKKRMARIVRSCSLDKLWAMVNTTDEEEAYDQKTPIKSVRSLINAILPATC